MCAFLVPVAAAVSIAAAGATTGMSIHAAKKRGSAEAEQAERNAQEARKAAVDAERRGEERAAQSKTQGSAVKAQQRVAFAANGVDLASTTAVQTMAGTEALSELDAERERNNAWREAYGYRTQGADFQLQGAYAQTAANQQVVGTILGGAGAILNTVGNAAGSFGGRQRGLR